MLHKTKIKYILSIYFLHHYILHPWVIQYYKIGENEFYLLKNTIHLKRSKTLGEKISPVIDEHC